MKFKTCFADMLMLQKLKNDTLKISKFYKFHFCIFKVLQCMALGAALDICVFLLPEEYLTDRLNNYCWCPSMTWL